MTKHIFVALMMMVVLVGSIQAQGLMPRRAFGRRPQRQMDSAALLASATNEAERAQIEQRIKNGELPEPLIPIEEALALAEKGDGKGYYQLAVRYAKGEGVETSSQTAAKFLKKSCEANYPRAVLASALVLEGGLLNWSNDVHFLYKHYDRPQDVHQRMAECLGVSLPGSSYAVEIGAADELAWEYNPGYYGCVTNTLLTSRVRKEYERALQLGMKTAQEELRRLDKKLAQIDCKLAEFNRQKLTKLQNDQRAQMLLKGACVDQMGGDDAKELDRKAIQDKEECDFWNSWPEKLDVESTAKIVEQAEAKFNCVFWGEILDWGMTFTNGWKRGCGVSFVVQTEKLEGLCRAKV